MSSQPSTPLFEETIPGGAMWSMRVARHRLLRLTALDAGANVSALLYNADDPLDRLNVPDTLKAQRTARLTRGHVLMSDMGRALASIVGDSLGWHDPLGGHGLIEHVIAKYGSHNYQEYRNAFYRNARDNFLVELGKHGLGIEDIVANVNFFSKVAVAEGGQMAFVPGHCPAGAAIDLRTEMNVLLVLANNPHPLDPAAEYPLTRVKIEILPCEPAAADDFCRTFRPECARALALAERLFI
jgi:urea carboxylase-associated protein 2